MKIAVLIARILLGLEFLIFGLNKFFHFFPVQVPPGTAGQYLTILVESRILLFVALLEVIGGLLLLAGRFVPLALVLLAPVLVNILLYHTLLAPEGVPIAVISILLWGVVFAGVRKAFAGIFAARV